PDENAVGAQPPGSGGRHRRTHSGLTRLVAGRADHPALRRRRPDNDWLAAQGWIVALLDRGVERIHVQMENDPKHRATLTHFSHGKKSAFDSSLLHQRRMQ